MSEPAISDLNAAFNELAHWGNVHAHKIGPRVSVYVREIRIAPGLTGETKGEGETLSAAIYAALQQLRVVRATVPPIPIDASAKERTP
jgi:hypothetical protein